MPHLLIFDLDQVLEHRPLTRAVAEAKAELLGAKTRPVVAGAYITSIPNTESGSVFDPVDGDPTWANPIVLLEWVRDLPGGYID